MRVFFAILGIGLLLGNLFAPGQAQDLRFFRIGTGGIAGTYYPIGGMIAHAVSNPPGAIACDDGGSCGPPGLVVIALPLLVHQLWRGTLIKVRINKRNGNIEINHRTFRAKWADHRHVSQLRELRIEVSDNDGEFFSVYLVFADGEKLHVVHGNYRQGVMKECGELQAFLEEAGAKITRNEVKV